MESQPAPLGRHLLGVTEAPFEVSGREPLTAVCLELASQVRRSLDIVSRHLDPLLYDNDAFAAAVKKIALGHRHARIRLFIIDARPLITQSHRLIDAALRLPNFIEIRTPSVQNKSFNEAWLVADNLGYMHRQFSESFEAEVDFSSRRRATALSEKLDEMWERGQRDPNFRRLHL